jgi:hypothetical protein
MLPMCFSTALADSTSRHAMAVLECPSAIRASSSRAVNAPRAPSRRIPAAPSNFHDLAADDATTALIINVITAVGQFQRDLQNELTAEGIAAAEAEGRYRGRPPALTEDQLQQVRAAFRDKGTSIAGLAREHGVSRVAVRTALADLLASQRRHRC